MARVAVIGGGIAGLLSSINLLKDHEVHLYEVSPKLGHKPHCTGVVSLVTAHECLGKEFIDNHFSRLVIRLGRFRAEFYSSTPFACRLSRLKHESFLGELIRDLGGSVYLKHRVLKVIRLGRGYELVIKDPYSLIRRVKYDYVVITEGYPPKLTKELGLTSTHEYLVGAQYRVRFSKALSEELTHTLIVNYCIDPTCGFTWVTPLSRREALVGIASKYYVGNELIRALNKVLKTVAKTLRTDYRIEKLFGGYVLRGYPETLAKEGTIVVGDATPTTKPISGGGIYPITKITKEINQRISKEELKKLGKETIKQLRKQYLIYKTIKKLRKTIEKIKTNITTKITPQQYDQHEKIITNLIKQIKIET